MWTLVLTEYLKNQQGCVGHPHPARPVHPLPWLGLALTWPSGFRSSVTQPWLKWMWKGSWRKDTGRRCFLVLLVPSPHTWERWGVLSERRRRPGGALWTLEQWGAP
jgi:hypothetical protein